jgi:hypothetical protein
VSDAVPAGVARFPWARLLGLVVAGGLLWFVASRLPWSDSLVVRWSADGVEETWTGELLGDWKADAVRFRVDAGQDTGGPEVARALLRAGGELGAGASDALLVDGRARAPAHQEWRPGLPRVFREMDARALVPALGFLFLCTLLIATRWWLLLVAAGCATRWWIAARVTYVGLFFNVIVPGISGGDIARAYIVVKDHTERRADALLTVLADRVLGLLAMALLSVTVIWFNDARFATLRIPVSLALLAMVGGLAAFLNPWLRRLVRFDALMRRLPQGQRLLKLDLAARHYARRPGTAVLALLLSAANHVGATACIFVLGRALGDHLSFLDYLCIATIANTLTAVPLSPGGLGVGEVLFGELFELAGGSYTIGVAASLTYRLCLVGLGVLGGLFLLAPGGREVREEFLRATDELPPPD